LTAAILLLIAEMFLPDRRRRRAKTTASAPSASAAVAGTMAAALAMLLAFPTSASASASGALREYQAGRYEDALKDYHSLLERKQDDPRLAFNAGTAAYQSRHLNDAVTNFNSALSSPDWQMQQRAYYNLGNTYYRLGEHAPAGAPGQGMAIPGAGAEVKMKAWEQAVQNYENALKLDPKDEDAKFNHAFVQKQLEELKKQQQQQQQSKDKSNDQKDQKQQQDQSKKDSQKDQDQQQQQQQQKDQQQSQEKKDQQQQQQSAQNKPDGGKDKKDQSQSQAGKQDKKDQSAQAQPAEEGDKSKEESEREAAMMAAGEMTPQQARQLLDSAKNDDQVLRLAPPDKQTPRPRSFKNW
jgi:Ca-activated chloride channel family protein